MVFTYPTIKNANLEKKNIFVIDMLTSYALNYQVWKVAHIFGRSVNDT